MDHSKTLIAALIIMVSGFLLVIFNHIFKEESGAYSSIVDANKLKSYARQICVKAAQDKVGAALYSPTEIKDVGENSIEVNWKPTETAPHGVICRYEQTKGVTELNIDGQSKGAVSVDISEDPAASAPGKMAEKHWGHWK